jgi:uncharacterized protein (DUF4415 family)
MAAKKRASRTDFARLDASVGVPDADIPEVTDAMLDRAVFSIGGVVLPTPKRRGRPPGSGKKEHVNVRIDRDVLAKFRASGRGWQTRINAALRASLRGKPTATKAARRSRSA